jgi:hypothetical protein
MPTGIYPRPLAKDRFWVAEGARYHGRVKALFAHKEYDAGSVA